MSDEMQLMQFILRHSECYIRVRQIFGKFHWRSLEISKKKKQAFATIYDINVLTCNACDELRPYPIDSDKSFF